LLRGFWTVFALPPFFRRLYSQQFASLSWCFSSPRCGYMHFPRFLRVADDPPFRMSCRARANGNALETGYKLLHNSRRGYYAECPASRFSASRSSASFSKRSSKRLSLRLAAASPAGHFRSPERTPKMVGSTCSR